jgi:hypothetical protein
VLAAPLAWTAYIVVAQPGWGWLNGVPLGPIEAAAIAVLWWTWAADRHLPGRGFAILLVIAKLASGGLLLERGLTARYFANDTSTGPPERSLEFGTQAYTRVDQRLAFGVKGAADLPLYFINDRRFGFYLPGEPQREQLPYSAEWQGFLRVDGGGTPTFYLDCGPGVSAELSIDDRPLVAADGTRRVSASATLTSGWHAIRLRLRAPYGAARRMEAGEIIDGTTTPFGDHVFAEPAGPTAAAVDNAMRLTTRVIDTVVLCWLAVLAMMRTRGAWRRHHIVYLLWLGALVEALLFARAYWQRVIVLAGGGDMLTYEHYARTIALGDVIGGGQAGPFYYQPLYPYFVALTHLAFGDSLFGVVLVQRVLLVATIAWVAAMTRRLFGARTGVIALVGGGVFLYAKGGQWTDVLLAEPLFMPLLAGWTALLVRLATDEATPVGAATAGLLGGIATLTRSTLLIGWPPILLLWWASLLARRVQLMAALLVAMLAVVSVATLRNWIVAHRFVPIATSFGINLHLGNQPASALQPTPANRATVYDRLGVENDVRAVAEYAIQAPVEFAGGLRDKALYATGFFGRSGLPGGIGTSWMYVGTWLLAAAGMIRIFATRHAGALVWLPAAGALSHLAMVVLIFPHGYTDRLILPLYPLLLPYAAFALDVLPAVTRRIEEPVRPVMTRAGLITSGHMSAAARTVGRSWAAVLGWILRRPFYALCIAYSVAVIVHLDWRPEDGDAVSMATAMLLPLGAAMSTQVARRTIVYRAVGGLVFAGALAYVAARGSLSPEAVRDPLFWGAIAALLFGVSRVSSRWPRIAAGAALSAGASTMVTLLLPAMPASASGVSAVSISVIRQSVGDLTAHLGVVAVVLLVSLWVHAVATAGRAASRSRVAAAAAGALAAALIIVLAGAVTRFRIEPGWFATLGTLIGLAEARPAAASRPPGTSA